MIWASIKSQEGIKSLSVQYQNSDYPLKEEIWNVKVIGPVFVDAILDLLAASPERVSTCIK